VPARWCGRTTPRGRVWRRARSCRGLFR
jgi:hypothetical protein